MMIIRKITYWLSLFLVFTMPWESIIEFGALGTMSHVMGFLAVGSWIASLAITNRIRKPHEFHIVFAVYALWHFVSIIWTIDPQKTQVRFVTYIQLIILVYLLWDLYQTPKTVRAALQAYVLGGWVSIGSLAFNFVEGIKASYTRYTATGFGENNIGIILALGIPIAWYLITSKGSSKMDRLLMVVNYIYMPAAVFGIMLTGSRASLITTGFAFLYVLGSLNRLKLATRAVIFMVLIAAIYGVFTLIPEGLIHRLGTTTESIESADLNGRVIIWRASLDVFEKHPLIGIGTNAFASSTDLDKAAHNTYLSILVEVGLIGFILFLILVVIIVYNTLAQPKHFRQFWLAILMVLAVGILTLNWGHRKQAWLFPSLIVASAASFKRSENEL